MDSLISVFTTPTALQEVQLDDQEANVLTYIGGYMVIKTRQHLCEVCRDNISSDRNEDNPDQYFLRAKNYNEAKEGLLVPSEILVNFLKNLEVHYREIVDDVISKPSVKTNLYQALMQKVDCDGLKCSSCVTERLAARLYINVSYITP